jgi:hypothetical protein
MKRKRDLTIRIYTVSNPHHSSANIDILTHGKWINRMNLTTLDYNLFRDGPMRGESVAFSCFGPDVVYYPVPTRIREFLSDLPADCYHYQSPQSKEDDAAQAWHEYEAERDPEGAFGGRGNNVRH